MPEVAVLALGMLVSLPFVRWWANDVAEIPGPVWFWSGHHRSPWRRGVAAGWLLGGWAAILIVLIWARSDERRELRLEALDFFNRRDATAADRRR
jgi:hypothetical protein